ncbi:MAG TPA: DUF6498-containing protein [Vicinamibacterales bacterium]|nr:DUF6498-containing protein [Vicinamibacterales bacterium]
MIQTSGRKARPERIRISLSEDSAGATQLALPDRRMWPLGLALGAMFAVFAGIEAATINELLGHSVDDVFDLMSTLFLGFWALGWLVGVVVLGAMTFLFLFYRESARLQHGRLIHVPRLGPLNIFVEYDLAKVRNLRLEQAGSEDQVRIRFDYGAGSSGLGDVMRRSDAERLISTIQNAATAAALTSRTPEPPRPRPREDLTSPAPDRLEPPTEATPLSILSPSGLALIAANLLPLAGVLFFGWDLAEVFVLFWAESGVIAFYTALKMAVVGKLFALLAIPFFIGHFGGFMAGHFLFIYAFFVRGVAASGPAPGVREALLDIFDPLWTALAALFLSHGVSFFTNFIGRREYVGAKVNALMTAPYKRIVVMHLALIFGGWIIMLLHSPVPALALLIVLKTVMDFSAHRKEHGMAERASSQK